MKPRIKKKIKNHVWNHEKISTSKLFNLFVVFKKTRFGTPKSTIQFGTLRFLWVISTHVARRYKETKLSRRAFQPTAGGSARFERDQRTTPGEEFDVQFVFAKFFFPVTFLGGKKRWPLKQGLFWWPEFFGWWKKRSLGSWCDFFGSFWNTTNY